MLYRHVVHRLAMQRGMQTADADDLTQQVLWSVSRAIERFDPDAHNARFRTWLRKIAHNAIINALGRQRRDRGAGGSVAEQLLDTMAATEEVNPVLEAEYRREIFLVAAAQVRKEVGEESWSCFWETTIAQRSIEDIAQQFNRTRGSVYTVRCRIVKRLKQIVERLDAQEDTP